ncbi:MAG: hypothetical protein J5741_03015 [Bacteroidales bacterium]|nr:hypothetical protein [Bacteroidales bacterium]
MKKFFFLLTFLCCIGFIAAQTPQIVTGHPDFKVKVARCAASGKTVILDLIFTNVSATDVEDWSIYTIYGLQKSEVYDSEGNIYDVSNLSVKVSNRDFSSGYYNLKMISEVPMKVSLQITGVPTTVESLARVDLVVFIPFFNIGQTPVKIKNIPISR